ncbi:MAG: hypothetical protein ACJ79P_24630 [Myxococcales bacterium]
MLLLIWSSDLLRSLFWPWAVALESADVWPFGPELVVMDLSELEEELSPVILALCDLLSEVLLELGVELELELVSWLCARALGAASARARTDNAMNLIRCLRVGCVVYAKVGDHASHKQCTTPREAVRGTSRRGPEAPKHEEPAPADRLFEKIFAMRATPRRKTRSRRCASRSGS